LASHGSVASSLGVVVTPGNNTYGSYVQMMTAAQVTSDAFAIAINVNSNAVSAAARDALLKVGFDPAGGTSYTTSRSTWPSVRRAAAGTGCGASRTTPRHRGRHADRRRGSGATRPPAALSANCSRPARRQIRIRAVR
jgi:hypothetical protein